MGLALLSAGKIAIGLAPIENQLPTTNKLLYGNWVKVKEAAKKPLLYNLWEWFSNYAGSDFTKVPSALKLASQSMPLLVK